MTTQNSQTLIKAAMENTVFMAYVAKEADDRTTADMHAFFPSESGESTATLLKQLRPNTSARMWRLFVAYVLEIHPQSYLCNQLLEQQLNTKWDRLGLTALVEHKNKEIHQPLCA